MVRQQHHEEAPEPSLSELEIDDRQDSSEELVDIITGKPIQEARIAQQEREKHPRCAARFGRGGLMPPYVSSITLSLSMAWTGLLERKLCMMRLSVAM